MRALAALAVPAIAGLVALVRRWLRESVENSACDIVVKLGGSAITKKSQFETLNEEALHAAAAALAAGGQRAVVLHGAGSFGHFQAREYGVSKGVSHPTFSWRGFALTRASVTKLNHLCVGALLREGVDAVSVSPFPRWTTAAKAVAHSGLAELRETLAIGLTPVLHGDAVLDSTQGATILSGDTLVVRLAEALRPRLVVFLTDVAGVYDRPPTEAGATLLRRLAVDRRGNLASASTVSTTTAAHDVTGGLATKLVAAAQCAACGVPVVIVEVGTVHAETALRGEVPEVCTLVTRGL